MGLLDKMRREAAARKKAKRDAATRSALEHKTMTRMEQAKLANTPKTPRTLRFKIEMLKAQAKQADKTGNKKAARTFRDVAKVYQKRLDQFKMRM